MPTTPRRRQRRVAFASDRAFARLQLLTRDGRSQAAVIEDALDRMPLPAVHDRAAVLSDVRAFLASLPARAYPSMADLDAAEYDDAGDCR